MTGCQTIELQEPLPGTLPAKMPDPPIEKNIHYASLVENYGRGEPYERAKIGYLLQVTKKAPYRFFRNGILYDGVTTAEHLQAKYKKRKVIVPTARDFITKIATYSSASGKPYLAKDREGGVYFTRDLLDYELNRLETFMDQIQTNNESTTL